MCGWVLIGTLTMARVGLDFLSCPGSASSVFELFSPVIRFASVLSGLLEKQGEETQHGKHGK